MKNTKTITYTKGDIIVEEIQVGDIQYDFPLPFGMKVKVITKPKKDSDGNWNWTSENTLTGKIIHYFVHRDPTLSQFAPNLYSTEAYEVNMYI